MSVCICFGYLTKLAQTKGFNYLIKLKDNEEINLVMGWLGIDLELTPNVLGV